MYGVWFPLLPSKFIEDFPVKVPEGTDICFNVLTLETEYTNELKTFSLEVVVSFKSVT